MIHSNMFIPAFTPTAKRAEYIKPSGWEKTYESLKEDNKIFDGDRVNTLFLRPEQGLVGIEFRRGGFIGRDARLVAHPKSIPPANTPEGTAIGSGGCVNPGVRVFFFDLSRVKSPTEGHLKVDFVTHTGVKTGEKDIALFVGHVDAQGA